MLTHSIIIKIKRPKENFKGHKRKANFHMQGNFHKVISEFFIKKLESQERLEYIFIVKRGEGGREREKERMVKKNK
jgi:hypothetical protein